MEAVDNATIIIEGIVEDTYVTTFYQNKKHSTQISQNAEHLQPEENYNILNYCIGQLRD